MNDVNKLLSIIAYYLSEYDMDAVTVLGYRTRSEAFKTISMIFHHDNNYLKLRRDEFDALPTSASSRSGWRNRPAAREVANLASYLRTFSFEELTDLVKSLIDNQIGKDNVISRDVKEEDIHEVSEEQLESLINAVDPTATLRIVTKSAKVRILNTSVIKGLKSLYKGCRQICGSKPLASYDEDICEAHHIAYFTDSQNNNASNIVILCPNHHRLIHHLNPIFDLSEMSFAFSDGRHEKIILNKHL